ncbi:MAG: hypothetical protein U1E65_11635 [Myxococcota bacterium]
MRSHPALALAALSTVVACAQTNTLDELTITTVGWDGGVAESADGLFALEFPPGVLSDNTRVSIRTVRAPLPPGLEGPAYDLGDNRFVVPRQATLRFKIRGEFEIVEIDEEGLRRLEGQAADVGARQLRAPVGRLGRYSLRRSAHADAGILDAAVAPPAPDAGETVLCASGAADAGARPDHDHCAYPSILYFGHVPVGTERERDASIYVCFRGSEHVTSYSWADGGGGFAVIEMPGDPWPVYSLTLHVRFAPTAPGLVSDTLILHTNTSSTPYRLNVSGYGGDLLTACTLATNTGTCALEVHGDDFISFFETKQLALVADRDCTVGASFKGYGGVGAHLTGADTATLTARPTDVDVGPGALLEPGVFVWRVASPTTAAGRLSLVGTRGGACSVSFSAFP